MKNPTTLNKNVPIHHSKQTSFNDFTLNQQFSITQTKTDTNKLSLCQFVNINKTKQKPKPKPNFYPPKRNYQKINKSSSLQNMRQLSSNQTKNPKKIINESLCSTENNNLSSSNMLNPNNSINIIKYQEELLDLQLKNSRMQNEIRILNEKTNSLMQIISMKETENELMKTKYNDYVGEFKSEVEYLKKINSEYKNYRNKYDNLVSSFKSLITILSELIEIFIGKTLHYTHRSLFSNKNETSFDIYDSFSNVTDEDRRLSIITQIQSLLITKMKYLDKHFNLSLEKEIDKIQNWNYISNNNNISNITNTISNISMINNNEISNSNSNEFDLSVSKTFYNQSPRFNSFNKGKKVIKKLSHGSFSNQIGRSSSNYNHNYSISNILVPKSTSNNTITQNFNINFPPNFNSNNTVNPQNRKTAINLDCSFGDIMN